LLEGAARWEANHADNERKRAQRQRRCFRCAVQVAARAGGGGGRKFPSSLNLHEMMMRRMKMRKRGR
jgi:hypothetical protein